MRSVALNVRILLLSCQIRLLLDQHDGYFVGELHYAVSLSTLKYRSHAYQEMRLVSGRIIYIVADIISTDPGPLYINVFRRYEAAAIQL